MQAAEAPAPAAPGAGSRAPSAALAGAAVALGWVLHDVTAFGAAGGTAYVLPLVPGSLVAILVAGLLGLLLGLRPRTLLVPWCLALVVASLLPRFVELGVSRAEHWLPRALLLGTLLAVVAVRLATRLGRGLAALGVALGLCGALLQGLWLEGWMGGSTLCVLVALALCASALLPIAALRTLAVPLLVACLLGVVVARGGKRSRVPRADLPAPSATAGGGSASPNLLLVVCDTVRASHLAPYGYERSTMPGVERLVAESAVRYANARSTTSWTLPSHASLFTGLMPAEHGATHPRSPEGVVLPGYPLRGDVPTLAEVLRAEGYRTAAIVANSYALRHQLGLDRGFERYDERRGKAVGDYYALAQLAGHRLRVGHVSYRDAPWITRDALAWIDTLRGAGPFFLTLNYLDAHLPYVPREPFERAFSDEQPSDPLAAEKELHALLYDRELLGLDEAIMQLLDGLRERGLYDDTVVVITSDHGESFGERDYWKHDWTLYDETVKVPLYLKPLGPREQAVVDDPVTGADVPHLALGALGRPELLPRVEALVQGEWYYLEGAGVRAVEPWASGPVVPPERLRELAAARRDLVAWIDGGRKVIVSSEGHVEAYDLAADPGETRPLALAPDEVARWRARAMEWWEAHPPILHEGTAADAEELEALRREASALGYAGG